MSLSLNTLTLEELNALTLDDLFFLPLEYTSPATTIDSTRTINNLARATIRRAANTYQGVDLAGGGNDPNGVAITRAGRDYTKEEIIVGE